MAWTLRTRDEYITDWHSNSTYCPLARALQVELQARGTDAKSLTNASAVSGSIVYVVGDYSYRIEPSNAKERQMVISYIAQVDGPKLGLGQPYPRKHVFRYSDPQPYYPWHSGRS